MQTIFTIALNELRIFFRARGNLIGLIVLPIAITVAVGWANSGRSGPDYLRVDLIDLDQSARSAALLTQLRAVNPTLRLCPMDNNADDLCRLGGEPLTDALERWLADHSPWLRHSACPVTTHPPALLLNR